MIWIAIHSAFGFECFIHDSLHLLCEDAGISESEVKSKYVEGMRCEVWDGEKMWVVAHIAFSQVKSILKEHMDMRRSKF